MKVRIPPRAWNLSASQWLALLSALSWEREQRPADIMTLLESLAERSGADRRSAADSDRPATWSRRELPQDLMPAQRSWGFFVFVACAIVVIFIAAQRQDATRTNRAAEAATSPATAASRRRCRRWQDSVAGAVERPRDTLPIGNNESFAADAQLAATQSRAAVARGRARAPSRLRVKRPAPPAALSEISFESPSIVTTRKLRGGSVPDQALAAAARPGARAVERDERHRGRRHRLRFERVRLAWNSPTGRRSARSTCRCATTC